MRLFGSPLPFSIDARINRAYAACLGRHGPTPQGVFWNSQKTQSARFAALLAAVSEDQATWQRAGSAPVIADIGCGYGALLAYMRARSGTAAWTYHGIDITPAMIRACRTQYPDMAAQFTIGKAPPVPVDYCLFSGTFNLCLIADPARWQRYILDALVPCWRESRHGMVLNLLCAATPTIRNHIFYASRNSMVAALEARFGAVTWHPTRQVKHDVTFLVTRRS